MIALGDASESFDRRILRARSGFGWWYGDLLDARGSGVVVIAAYGLPFLPGPLPPEERPSLNVAVYERGEPTLYLLQELEPEQTECLDDGCRLGGSRVESLLRSGRRALDVQLDCPLPGTTERLTGTIHIEGPAARVVPSGTSEHEWTPLALGAPGRACIEVGGRPVLDVRGRGYHDRNTSSVSLTDLGIAHWLWGRVPDGDREHVFYVLWPDGGGDPIGMVLTGTPDGRVERADVDVALHGARWTRYGLAWWRRMALTSETLGLDVHFDRIVDNGPFYQRFLVRGRPTPGFAERVVPSRVELPGVQPLVRTCVHRPAGASSFLAPWFVGPRQGRLARLLSSWRAA